MPLERREAHEGVWLCIWLKEEIEFICWRALTTVKFLVEALDVRGIVHPRSLSALELLRTLTFLGPTFLVSAAVELEMWLVLDGRSV